MEKLTRLRQPKSWDNYRSSRVAELIQKWRLGERKDDQSRSLGVEGCQLIGAPGVVLMVSNKAVIPVRVAKG